jgi:hypothetical protein
MKPRAKQPEPQYTLTVVPLADASDPRGIRRLRALLKRLLRSDRLRVVRCIPSPDTEADRR